jgi:purine-binding chemotaxis protein CheW
MLVDQVLDVLSLPATAIEQPGALVPLREVLSGIAKLHDRLVFLLDLGRLLAEERLERLSPVTAGAGEPREELRGALRKRTVELSTPVAVSAGRDAQSAAMVCFALGEGSYAVRAEYAKEIVQVPHLTPIPCAPAHVVGAVNIRGAIIVVVSVAELLGFRARGVGPPDPRIVVTEVLGTIVGLLVDRVVGIYEVEGSVVAPPFAQLESQPASCIEGEFDHAGQVICLIDAAAVVRTLDQAPAEGHSATGGRAR